eukprot:CAMPEP_0170588036 /NCGR_PEP_ID=MMETSP0224-20130122/10612_1 /TAXON_ID=285029 /ORGANISM="Togula jolla, Strain CCCM 725" /LENGTH=363 /DNA_ID=CAMNT_0010911719 /DNA_START=150 /DNA_END=1239 /DNA_ORIENTATION=+
MSPTGGNAGSSRPLGRLRTLTGHINAGARAATRGASNIATDAALLEVWSFNLRTEFMEETDGADGWSRRRQGVADLLAARRPALVCVQEATESMLSFLSKSLGEEYGWVATSRTPGQSDESAGFLFDRRRLALEDYTATWLAPPSTQPGTPAWDAGCPRTFETAVFRFLDNVDVGHLRVINTHLDHIGVQARQFSAGLLVEAILEGVATKPECAQLICGDFNSPKGGGNKVYELLTSTQASIGAGLRDVAREAKELSLGPSTIHKFKGEDFEGQVGDGTVDLSSSVGDENSKAADDARHIDWMLWRDGEGLRLLPKRCELVTDRLATGRYPSDHFPVSATFVLRGASTQQVTTDEVAFIGIAR